MTSTDIVKWRKTNDYENFEKGMIYMKISKKGGVVEKRGEEKRNPCPMRLWFIYLYNIYKRS
jgi:uncharacterized protein YehS (DUF1456 family)